VTATSGASPALDNDPVARTLAQALGSQYQLVRLLGRGGMGAVYLAREPFLERDVAVKVLPSDAATGDARERFLREARTAARLSHPNIVPLYTVGQAGEVLYYVMGFVDGESLETRLAREGALPADEVRRITSELADALHYAHEAGVVHRDVKPDNVLLDRATGRAMLTDFGIAKQRATLETLTQTGVIVGTPHYMSPEQGTGDRGIDGRSDIYSLGVIAYRMATGRLPFEGSALREVLMQHAMRAPIPPTQIVTSLPFDIDTAITRALAKEPTDRWPSARAMRDALSPESEESLPDELHAISGVGSRFVVLAAILGQVSLVGWYTRWFDTAIHVALLASAAVPLLMGPLMLIKPARRFGWRTVLQTWFRQPRWWSLWWPRFSRRPGDVWDRLPKDAWAARVVNGASLAVNLGLANWMFGAMAYHLRTGDDRYVTAVMWTAFASVAIAVGILAPVSRRLQRRLRALGLSKHDIARVHNESTSSTFWTRPHIATLLRAPEARRGAAGGAARDPRQLVREIEALAAAADPGPHADIYKEAAHAARTIHAGIQQFEAELAQLIRDADPRERDRIQGSLDALGAAATRESPAKAQMRELLARQLQIFRDMDARREQMSVRRDRLHEQLRTLALELARLRASTSADAAASAGITGRIQAVCREIDIRIDGAREVNALLS
jgi:hypothetical protein